ncbi:MAG TPA: formylglycine-generating enzyme family protein [Nocardioidaceae bacterium]|nr:formylglycine-generating enzyme family protein [Nocardioidaceae bacterium]
MTTTVGAVTTGMAWVDDQRFVMGSDAFYPEERPAHEAEVTGFWIDRNPVTNVDFAEFVADAGYLTVAERMPSAQDYPGAAAEALVPGSLVFQPTSGPVDLRDYFAWWRYVPGACWHLPAGPGSSLEGLAQHPVVHVAYADAIAYADWAGKALPTEQEWECAARGGREDSAYAWGDEPFPQGMALANTWQGRFPWENLTLDGYERTSPVGAFPPNEYGLLDMIGNVWEWTASPFRSHADPARDDAATPRSCCTPRREPAAAEVTRLAAAGMRAVKGGSHLCVPNYCLRYRPAARQPQTVDTSTGHLGFRCVARTG